MAVATFMRAGVIGGCMALAGGTGAGAQEHPLFLPTRDVAVTYDLGGGQSTHLYYSAGLGKLRIDTPNGAGYTVLDRPGRQRLMVMSDRGEYAAIPMQPGMDEGFILNNQASYRQGGPATVAGVACTQWSVSSAQMNGQACVTADGVLLSGRGQPTQDQQGGPPTGATSLTATSVVYAPQPASLFVPPAAYRRMDPAELQGGAGPGGPTGPGGPGPNGQGQ